MVEQRKCLTFGFKSRHDVRGIHAGFDHFDRHLPTHRGYLLGQPDLTHATFAEALQKTVMTDEAGAASTCPGTSHILGGQRSGR
jgi:hypothetical protein